MPLYRISWRLAHDVTWPQRRKWTTTAFLVASTAVQAAAAGVVTWIDALRAGTCDTIFCYEVYASDLSPSTDDYAVQAVAPGNQRGTINTTGMGQPYLAKACVTTTLTVAGSRPSRKFWRCGLYEGTVINGSSIDSAIDTAVRNAWAAVVADEVFCDPDSQLYTGVGSLRLGTREFGRYAGNDVPSPPVG